MRKTIFAIAVIFISLCRGWSEMSDATIGKYKLKCGYLTRWGTDYISIDKADGKIVAGKIGIDWSIGPEARLPLDWEKFYEMKFAGKLSKDGNSFAFDVTVGGRIVYQFTLFFLWVDRPVLTGFVKIKPLKKEYAPVMTVGVFAEKIEEN
ncbi:MAG: hypothetical protein A2Y33_00350 [Spirochaetes bacterium GWF1_51_8]|nr:MAG: hypothetical protein A2Y33_00350 [Spirochaetes bacterium GWF1_51_8]